MDRTTEDPTKKAEAATGHNGSPPKIRDQAQRLKVLETFAHHMYRPMEGSHVVEYLGPVIQRVSEADPKNVQQIAASQLELLTAYHQVALGQSNRSFFWALVGSGLGLLLFGIAVAFSLLNSLSLASIVPLIAGAVVNVVSGIVFVLYGKTSSQLSAFHSRLDVLQRYLLANSICEGLSEAERDKARSALIGEISRGQSLT